MTTDPSQRSNELKAIAKAISQEVGVQTLRALHREDRRLDALAVVGSWALVALLFSLLGTLPFGPLWLLLYALQGCALQNLGFCAHDLFVHRKVAGLRWSRVLSIFCLTPLLLPASKYEASHLDHHWYLASERDSEAYKEDLDRLWVKLLCLLAPGYLLAYARAFHRPGSPAPVPPQRSAEQAARIRQEVWIVRAFVILVALAACLWPRLVIAGLVLPVLLSLPFASTVRLILEHGETDPKNSYHAATCYTAGPITGALFLWSVGDAHLIHHLFPNIPFYRLRKAREAMLPILLRQGVVRRASLPWLIYQWFVANRRHATLWT